MCVSYKVMVAICLLYSANLYGQATRRVEVFNRSDGEPIVAAEVYAGAIRRAITDENGGFTLPCSPVTDTLTLLYFGADFDLVVPGTNNCREKTRLPVNLALSLREVTVRTQNIKGTSSATYSVEALTRPPVLLGQPDILRALTLRSGISHGQEGNANIFVRGGTPDQNLILLDDAPVYNVNHLGGFMSIFNDDAINSVSVYKTTPPLAYGNRLSSVIDVRLKNGSDKSWRGKFGIGIVSANFFVEGPLIKDKTTLIAGVRTGYLDLVNLGINKDSEEDFLDLRMSDYVFKLSHTFSERHRLFLSSYRSTDVNGINENVRDIRVNGRNADRQFTKITARYGNQTFSIRDYLELSGSVQLISFVYSTTYRNGYERLKRTYYPDFTDKVSERVDSELVEIGGVTQLRLAGAHADYLFGVSYLQKQVDPLNAVLDGLPVLENPLTSRAGNLTVFGGYDYQLNERFKFTGGVRVNHYSNEGYQRTYTELRGRLDYRISADRGISVSGNTTGQDLQLLSSGTLGENTDAYVLANSDLPLQTGWQTDVGYHQPLGGFGTLKIGYYFRRMDNIIFYKNQDQGVEETAAILRETTRGGEGFSHGLELEAEIHWRSLTAQGSYTLSQTKQRFAGLNAGRYFPFRYDRPHDISLSLNYSIGDKYSIGTNFVFQSGIAVTTPTARVPVSDNYINYNVVPSINNARFPAYNRLDLSVTHDWTGKRNNRNILRLSVYNAYNRVNPTFYSSNATANFAGAGEDVITVRTLRVGRFGFLPTVYYSREIGWHE